MTLESRFPSLEYIGNLLILATFSGLEFRVALTSDFVASLTALNG
uniref:Uncharacterized protein n=1 Tax=Rhizophora mucronata TaxID=61149 RepID=A0A2P2PCG4_RHIMU